MFFFECEIRKYISDKNIVFLQYESLYERAITAPIGKWKSFIEKHTLELDLTFSSDELLAQMKPKGRYNIKLAEKQGVRVRKGDQLQDIESFIQLLEETLERDGFSGNSKFYYQTLLTSVHDPIE